MARTVVGLFDRLALAEHAMGELQRGGFEPGGISVLASGESDEYIQRTAGESAGVLAGMGAGAAVGGVAGLVLGLAAMAIPGVGPLVAAGPVAASLGTAGVGAAAGGLLGALTGVDIPESDAHHYAEGMRRGGALVMVATDDERAAVAQGILDHAGAVDIEERGKTWHAEGWRPLGGDAKLNHSPGPQIPGTPLSGSRVYQEGPEMNSQRGSFDDFNPVFRRDFQHRYGASGYTYQQFIPAYQFGYDMAQSELYRGKDWSTAGANVQREWEQQNPNTWEQVKDAIRFAYETKVGAPVRAEGA